MRFLTIITMIVVVGLGVATQAAADSDEAGQSRLAIDATGVDTIIIQANVRVNLHQGEDPVLLVSGDLTGFDSHRIGQQLILRHSGEPHIALEVQIPRISTLRVQSSESSAVVLNISGHKKFSMNELSADRVCISFKGHGQLSVARIEAESLKVDLTGHGQVEFDDLQVAALEVGMTGHGKVVARGLVGEQEVRIRGMGRFDNEDLVVNHALVWDQQWDANPIPDQDGSEYAELSAGLASAH